MEINIFEARASQGLSMVVDRVLSTAKSEDLKARANRLDSSATTPIAEEMSVSPIQVSASSVATRDDRAAIRGKTAREEPTGIVGPRLQPPDEAVFSAEALALSRRDAVVASEAPGDAITHGSVESSDGGGGSGAGEALTDEERQQVEKLKARDAEVRAHEAAHMAAGGAHVRGGATYTYEQGPDGKQYAIGGEVGIDVSSVTGNPQATIQKMQQVRAAALAPGDPSGADQGVAAKAAQVEAQAREQLAAKGAGRIASAYAGARESSPGVRIDAIA